MEPLYTAVENFFWLEEIISELKNLNTYEGNPKRKIPIIFKI